MKLVHKYPKLGSSVEPEKVALRIRTALYAAVPLVLFIAQLKGWDIGEEGLKKIFDEIITWGSSLAVVIAGIFHVWGWIRKFRK